LEDFGVWWLLFVFAPCRNIHNELPLVGAIPKRKGQKNDTETFPTSSGDNPQKSRRRYHGNKSRDTVEITADFVQLFQQANPRFDVVKFYEACGMDSEGLWVI
jgi:hypothetical protein